MRLGFEDVKSLRDDFSSWVPRDHEVRRIEGQKAISRSAESGSEDEINGVWYFCYTDLTGELFHGWSFSAVKKGVCLVKTAVAQKFRICGRDEKVTPSQPTPWRRAQQGFQLTLNHHQSSPSNFLKPQYSWILIQLWDELYIYIYFLI